MSIHSPRARISFVVPVRNDATGIKRCLASITAAAKLEDYEVVVIDNGSIDGSAGIAATRGGKVLASTGSVAKLRNHGARAASGELLAFVDADHEIGSGWSAAAIQSFEDPAVGAVGAPYHPPVSANWVQRTYNLLRDHRAGIYETGWLGSGNLVVRKSCFEAVGGFDESLETCEDVDLCQRLKLAGFRVLSDSRLRSTHYGDPSSLKRLFMSELWRGRDNLRVSMRAPSLRDFPSVAIPIFDLMAGLIAALAIAGWGLRGSTIGLAALGAVVALAWLRATRMVARAKDRKLLHFAQACTVALLYDVARALALVIRMPHRRAAGPLKSE